MESYKTHFIKHILLTHLFKTKIKLQALRSALDKAIQPESNQTIRESKQKTI